MKRKNIKKINRLDIYSKLLKEGFKLDTLLSLTDNQLYTLSSKILNEVETTQTQTQKYKLDVPSEVKGFKEKVTDQTLNLNPENIEIVDDTAVVTTDMNEDEELTPNNEPEINFEKGGKEVTLLGSGEANEEDLGEEIMDMGAGDFDDPNTQTYNFTSQGPEDGEEGLNEFAPQPNYSFRNPESKGFQSDGPRGNSGGLYEDDEFYESLEKVQKDNAGMDTDQDAPQEGPDNNSNADDGMGMFETITKKELMEKFASKAQQKYMFANKPKAAKKLASKMTKGDYKKLPEYVSGDEPIDESLVENWIMGLVEKYERPSMTKSQLLDTLNEIVMMDAPTTAPTKPGIDTPTKPKKPGRKNPYLPKHKPKPKAMDNDVEDAKYELPSWLDFDSLFTDNANSPTTVPTKPGIDTPTKPKKPGRKNPYLPKHKPKPKAIGNE